MANWTRHDTRALIEASPSAPVMTPWVVKAIRRHHHEPGLVERMARLEDFVTGCPPHVWGKSDCSLVIADWVVANGHEDPGNPWRGTYSNERECRDLLAQRGGLLAHIADCAESVGLLQIHEPEFGCIAVIGSPHNEERQWSAIWQGFSWLVKWGDERAAQWVPFKAKSLAMWRV